MAAISITIAMVSTMRWKLKEPKKDSESGAVVSIVVLVDAVCDVAKLNENIYYVVIILFIRVK